MSIINFDEKHGLNPSLDICFYCGEDKGVVLFGKLNSDIKGHFESQGQSEDGKAPRKVVMTKTPCKKCIEHMKQGVLFISIDESKTVDEENPYRTGYMTLLKEEAVVRIFCEDMSKKMLERRAVFLPDEMWDLLKLPRGEYDN